MTVRVPISPAVLHWALQRAEWSEDHARKRSPKWDVWSSGEAQPTWRQAQDFAQATNVPFGRLFLAEPPDERLPVADFRRMVGKVNRPSGNLLDTLYGCMERQQWYRDYAQEEGLDSLNWVGSASVNDSPAHHAGVMRDRLHLTAERRAVVSGSTDWMRAIREALDHEGVLVMVSGAVEQNSHRVLNPEEFRGFALADHLAPLIFVNGRDAPAAQVFTIAHELGHLCLGQTGVSNAAMNENETAANERWCNAFAAEFLVPGDELRLPMTSPVLSDDALDALSRTFKVSRLVILRRLLDVDMLTRQDFNARWAQEWARATAKSKKSGGGNFYATHGLRLGQRLIGAVLHSTAAGTTSYSKAFRLAGVKSLGTFLQLVATT